MPLQGQFQQTNFLDNTGGTNLADSVFRVKEGQAAGGYNFDYTVTGGIRKRKGPTKINTVADSQLLSKGFGVYAPASGASKTPIRAGGTKLQAVDTAAVTFTALTEDTVAAGSTPFTSSTVPVKFAQFNNGTSNALWAVGGGATLPVGATSSTKYTQNGVPAPTASSFTATPSGVGGTLSAGVWRYTLVYRKASTLTYSNAVIEASATTTGTTSSVALAWTLSNNDTTKYDQILVYRSTVNGSASFTTGSLIKTLASSATSYNDTGTSEADAQNVPRAGSVVLDNSVLPSGTYAAMTVFKRRLVVAVDSTLQFSEVNKSESWPLTNIITVPSVGPITALAVISFTSPQAQSLDELLVVFKEREIWVISGSAYQSDSVGNVGWALKFIDDVGCVNQNLVVTASGFLAWVELRGVFLWDGTSKPIYASRLLEPLFSSDGDLNKAKLNIGCAVFSRRDHQIVWYLSSKLKGEQRLGIKMDLRLSLPQIQQNLTGRNIDGAFIVDQYTQAMYATISYIPLGGSEEILMAGDASGFSYYAFNGDSDADEDFSFTYLTKATDCGDPATMKQFHRVIVWVADYGNWNLYLDYWSDYRVTSTAMATLVLPISTGSAPDSPAYWDQGYWDQSFWDSFPNTSGVRALIFNLNAGNSNSNIGASIQLQFRNETADQPITIHGFSVQWSPLGGV
jgi:hypothetical protein